MVTNIWLGDSILGIKLISLGQRWTVGSKKPLLQVNSLERRKPKKANVKAAHSIMWSTLKLKGGREVEVIKDGIQNCK